MNRRKFIMSASAGLALVGNTALAQRRGSGTSNILTSELTGGEIDTSGSSLDLRNQHMEEADGSEHFHFVDADNNQFDIVIWPQASGAADAFVQSQMDMFAAVLGSELEDLGSDSYDDGGWLAFDLGNVAYYEYQLGAYPGHDLVVAINSAPESFGDTFEQAQAVLIDGLPPFLFNEESDIVALAATRTSASSSSSSRSSRGTTTSEETNSRSSRGSRSSTSNNTSETGESGRSSRTDSGGDPVETVRSHRTAFLDSYDEFYALLQTAADESSSNQEVDDAFISMVSIAQDWQQFPTDAGQVQFGSEHAELKAVYLNWADIVGELGLVFEDFYMGVASVDDFLEVYEAWSDVDNDLRVLLRNSGQLFQRRALGRRTVAQGFHSLGATA